jgi:hypothetical protein
MSRRAQLGLHEAPPDAERQPPASGCILSWWTKRPDVNDAGATYKESWAITERYMASHAHIMQDRVGVCLCVCDEG